MLLPVKPGLGSINYLHREHACPQASFLIIVIIVLLERYVTNQL